MFKCSLLLAQVTLLCFVVGPFNQSVAAPMRMYHIDVEQADATLIVSPSGKTLLIDSGKNGHGARIRSVMDAAGVSVIDYFVCTHYHEDHFGGIDDLVRDHQVTVRQSYDRGDKEYVAEDKRGQQTFKDYEVAVGDDAIALTRGKTIPFDPEVTVTCISSGGVVIGEDPPVPAQDENDMSVSLLLSYHGFTYFVGGDIEEPTESKIADRDLVQNVDIYLADHHGSSTSSSAAFMRDLQPSVIIISNGNNGTYRHPRKAVLDFYATLPGPPAVYQTNKYLKGRDGGNVQDDRIADPETNDMDGTILVTVNDNGKYVVTYEGNAGASFTTKKSIVHPVGGVVIASLLPNPVGPDEDLEEVTITNRGSQSLSLTGWKLVDGSGFWWELSREANIPSGQTRTVVRRGRPMSLNNAGDEISLMNQLGVVVDTYVYTTSLEGVSISTGH